MSNQVNNFNVIITGDKNTGKTTFINKYVTKNFVNFPTSLKENVVSFSYKSGRVVENCTITFIEKSLTSLKKAEDSFPCHGLIVLFNVTDKKSREHLDFYLKNMDGQVPVVICGNKSDLQKSTTDITFNCEKYKNTKYYPCSVKNNIGISDAILSLIKRINNDSKIVWNNC
jgi:GTPase SAR1 family protein